MCVCVYKERGNLTKNAETMYAVVAKRRHVTGNTHARHSAAQWLSRLTRRTNDINILL